MRQVLDIRDFALYTTGDHVYYAKCTSEKYEIWVHESVARAHIDVLRRVVVSRTTAPENVLNVREVVCEGGLVGIVDVVGDCTTAKQRHIATYLADDFPDGHCFERTSEAIIT